MSSSEKKKVVIPFSLKLSAPKRIQKKPDPKAILKVLEKVDPNKAAEKKAEEGDTKEKKEQPQPQPAAPKVPKPSAFSSSLEGKDEPISFSIGQERRRVSKLGNAVKKLEAPVVTKPVVLPPPIEESWKNGDVEKVDKEFRPSYAQPKKPEPKAKGKSDKDSDSDSGGSKKRHKSSHSKHKDKDSKSHSSNSKHKDKHHSKSKHESHSDSRPSKHDPKPKPPKRKPPRAVHNPPPINFEDLMKMAAEKQNEPLKFEPTVVVKKKPEGRPRTQEEIEREARRKTKEYQDWLKHGGPRPSQGGTHALSADEDSCGSGGPQERDSRRDLQGGLRGEQEARKRPKLPHKPRADQSQVLIDSLFSDAVHLGSNSAKKQAKPDRPVDGRAVNDGASSKDLHDAKLDRSSKLSDERKSEKRPREDSNSRDSSEFSKRFKPSSHEHHSGHKQHKSLEHSSKPPSSHSQHNGHKNGIHSGKRPLEQPRGPPGSEKRSGPAVNNSGLGAGTMKASVPKDRPEGSGMSSKHKEHPVSGGKHLPPHPTSGGKHLPPHPTSGGKHLPRPKEGGSAGKPGPSSSSQGLRPPMPSRPGQAPMAGGKGSIPRADRPQPSAPRIIDCSPQSPPRKAPKPSAPPPPYVNPFDRIMERVKKNNPKPAVKPKKRRVIESDEEEDSDMDSFLASDDDEYTDPSEISKAIKSVFNYDRRRYRDEDDDDLRSMEANFAMQEAEERRSYRLGLKEDQEEERKEEMRKRQKILMKKGHR